MSARSTRRARWPAVRIVWTVVTALFLLVALSSVFAGVEEVILAMHLRSREAYAAAELLESAGGKRAYAVVTFSSPDGGRITTKTDIANGRELERPAGEQVSAACSRQV